ncbi:MAG: glycoside hydrolase family 3 C-terminal domain-containing protein [bacterium]|nr:glycoside hydrolase family 3 C-terminal domain-containing protein [bacterium]
MNAEKLLPALKDGRVRVATIDDKIRRLLRLAICFGWLDHEQKDDQIPLQDEQTAAVALDVARGGCVLLRNEDALLPLDRARIKRLAVIGPAAHPAVIGAGGSSATTPWRAVSMRDGIAALAGDMVVDYAEGFNPYRTEEVFPVAQFTTTAGAPGIMVEYFNNRDAAGAPALTCVDERIDKKWQNGPLPEGIRVWLDEVLLFDGWDSMEHVASTVTRELEAGRAYRLRVEYGQLRGWNVMRFGWEHEDAVLANWHTAVDLARTADAVVFCGGFTARSEGEGYDRAFGMPALLEQLLLEVAAANANTVVVLTAGGNVDMRRWLDKVKGVLHAWYPGQEGGQAVAEILFGVVNPSGKLPATFEKQIEDRSSFACYHDDDKDKHVALTDGIFCGYRHVDKTGVTPQFPFGFGLSYTTFAYENMRVSAKTIRAGQSLTVTCEVVNTGTCAGAEIVQLYVRDVRCTVPRPVKELKGFAKVHLDAGARATAVIDLDERAFRFYHPERGWMIEPGAFELLLGASAQDIRLCARVTLKAGM